jgi:hypothetical protein
VRPLGPRRSLALAPRRQNQVEAPNIGRDRFTRPVNAVTFTHFVEKLFSRFALPMSGHGGQHRVVPVPAQIRLVLSKNR